MKGLGLSIANFVSDRHRRIAKWIRENCASTKHYFDIWHIATSITKKLLSASKEKGCEVIKDWMKGIRRHVYWCATSTKVALKLSSWQSGLHSCAMLPTSIAITQTHCINSATMGILNLGSGLKLVGKFESVF